MANWETPTGMNDPSKYFWIICGNAVIYENCTIKWQKTLTWVAVVGRLCDGFLQVCPLDLVSVPSRLPVLQCHFVNHLLSCGAAGKTYQTRLECDSICIWCRIKGLTLYTKQHAPTSLWTPCLCMCLFTRWRHRWPCGSWCQTQRERDPGRVAIHQ